MILLDRFVRAIPDDKLYKDRLDFELGLISQSNFERFFLEALDLVDVYKQTFGVEGKIPPFSIRGSAASSLTAYLLGLTHVDPVEKGMCFSRFINPLRGSPPDIDFDFSHILRDKLLFAFNAKFLVARVCNKVYYKLRSALRKVLSENYLFSHSEICKMMDTGNIPSNAYKMAEKYVDKFRYYSKHCGGIVIYKKALPYKDVTQKPKDIPQLTLNKADLEQRGIVKLDVLSNAALSQLHDLSLKALQEYPPMDDKITELYENGDTLGIPYCESPLFQHLLTKYKPRSRDELALILGLSRPVGSAIRWGDFERVDNETLFKGFQDKNYLVFDDDYTYFIQSLIGCTEAEAEQYRRGFVKRDGRMINEFTTILISLGIPRNRIRDTVKNLKNNAKYSFCKSHAFSMAQISWAITWHRVHHEASFWLSVLNHKMKYSLYRPIIFVEKIESLGYKVDRTTLKSKEKWKYNEKTKSFYKGGGFQRSLSSFFNITRAPIHTPVFIHLYQEKNNMVAFSGLLATAKRLSHSPIYLGEIWIGGKHNFLLKFSIDSFEHWNKMQAESLFSKSTYARGYGKQINERLEIIEITLY